MAIEIDVYKDKDLSLRDATIVDGFSSAGMISSIVANYLVDTLKLGPISFLDSDYFPSLSLIYNSKPKYPARIFADEEKKIVVFLSEFTPEQYLVKPIANTILSWAEENKCRRIITTDALLSREDQSYKEHRVYGVGNVDGARRDILAEVNSNGGIPSAIAAAKVIEVIDMLLPNIEIDVEPLYAEAEKFEDWIQLQQSPSQMFG